MTADFGLVVTERLELRPADVPDADELFPILSDAAGWWYDPAGRHRDLATSRGFAERAAKRWVDDGLSYWTVRRRDDGAVIGIGGVQRRRNRTWNLSYRIATTAQGQGFAFELARAGLDAATALDATVARTAWIAVENLPSRRLAEKLGLENYGPHVDGSDGVIRIAYADRPVGDEPWLHRPANVVAPDGRDQR